MRVRAPQTLLQICANIERFAVRACPPLPPLPHTYAHARALPGIAALHSKKNQNIFFETADKIQYLLAGRKNVKKDSTSTYVHARPILHTTDVHPHSHSTQQICTHSSCNRNTPPSHP